MVLSKKEGSTHIQSRLNNLDATGEDNMATGHELSSTKSDSLTTFRSNTPGKDFILSFRVSKVVFEDKRQRRVSCHLDIAWSRHSIGFLL